MSEMPLLSLVTFLPLIGAAFILLIRGDEMIVARNARYLALWTTLITFVLSLFYGLVLTRKPAIFNLSNE